MLIQTFQQRYNCKMFLKNNVYLEGLIFKKYENFMLKFEGKEEKLGMEDKVRRGKKES